MDDASENITQPDAPQLQDELSEGQTLAQGFLSPRHRRLAQLAAQGLSNQKIKEELGYSDSRLSILLRNPVISAEVRRLQDRIFEETIQHRLKSFSEPALNNIHMILTDRTNKVKISEKAEMSKWVIEKLDGKAAQKHELGENLLGVLMDRLDARKSAREVGVSEPTPPDIEVKALPEAPQEEDPLADWVVDFNNASS